MKRVLIILPWVCYALFSGLFAQRPDVRCPNPGLLQNRPEHVKNAVIHLRDQINAMAGNEKPALRQNCFDSIYRIPVVFHVIHSGGADSISATQIQTQMAVLREDYRKVSGTPGAGPGADTRIDFFLAQKDPFGMPTSGITYLKDPIADFTYSLANDTLLKSKVKWPQQRYLNIWVVDTIKYMGSYLLGYSSLPSNGTDILDGIVIADQHVGRDSGTASSGPYGQGRTLTHEIGHYLGLYHPFDYVTSPCEGDSAANCATSGDFVCDVPPHANPHFGCPTGTPNTCTEYPKDTADFVKNYMEYVDDSCMNHFSAGQAARMRNVLATDSFRILMTSTSNLINSGVVYHGMPDPFFMPMGGFCAGDTVILQNMTLGTGPTQTPLIDTQWMWSLPGASPDTSNVQNPMVYYQDTGSHPIMLTVVNSFGMCQYAFQHYTGGSHIQVVTDTVAVGNPTTFLANASESGTWSWNFGDGSGDSASFFQNPMYIYPAPGGYRYTATFTPDDTLNCVSRYYDSAQVVVSLPVALDFFKVDQLISGEIEIAWKTTREWAIDRFMIERSGADGNWIPIATVPAGLGQTGSRHYRELDQSPPAGWLKYRLSEIDREEVKKKLGEAIIRNDFEIAWSFGPNPAANTITIDPGELQGELQLWVEDLTGNEVGGTRLKIPGGHGKRGFGVADLPEGVYFLVLREIQGEKRCFRKKMIIQ